MAGIQNNSSSGGFDQWSIATSSSTTNDGDGDNNNDCHYANDADEDGNSSGNHFRLNDNNAPKTMLATTSTAAGQMAAMASAARSTVYSLEQEFDYEATEEDLNLPPPPPPPREDIDDDDDDSLMEDHIGHHHNNDHTNNDSGSSPNYPNKYDISSTLDHTLDSTLDGCCSFGDDTMHILMDAELRLSAMPAPSSVKDSLTSHLAAGGAVAVTAVRGEWQWNRHRGQWEEWQRRIPPISQANSQRQ